jgi:hypothetical protein
MLHTHSLARWPFSATAVALACFAAPAAHAQSYLYTNYGPGDSYSSTANSATFAGYGKSAARFVAPVGGEFDRVETSLATLTGFSVTATVSIVPEVTGGPGGGQPGLLSVWSASALSSLVNARGIYTFTGPRATLVAGQAYWLVLEATDSTFWYQTSPVVIGTTASKTGSPMWFTMPGFPLPAFRIVSAAPAPGLGACCDRVSGGCAVVEPAACSSLGLSFAGVGAACAASPSTCHACPGDFNRSGGVTLQDLFDFLGAWFAGCP